ncbi:MFS transporter [Flagellimonas eckloniae]|uniref:MFS transporter n=1 Tax=Flagellimonas eckloniae TaxID=346185 RepID=A0A0N8WFV9_9FLAO|nr:MFS transporter [Allomuricauda eckloniae]KQC29787.1 MFS transporter [Allomuricauda eckloniae]
MKVKGLRWWIIMLIFLATVINYIDRTAFALLWPEMGKDLGMDNSDYAFMLNLFMAAYAIGKFASGKLYDEIGTRLGFTVSIVVWSVACVFHAFAKGLGSLSLFRVLLGLGEAGNWPGAVKSNGEWFPVKERATAQGIFNSGASIGNVIAPFIIIFLYTGYGWKMTYVILGVVGLLWVIPWLFINKAKPENHKWITDAEKELILKDRIDKVKENEDKKQKGLSVLKILSYKESWGVLSCRFFIEPIWWFFVGWMPIYLGDRFGLNIKETQTIWISYLMAAAGSIIGGMFTGALMKKLSVDASRKITIAIGGLLILIAFVCIITYVKEDNFMAFIYLAGLALFGFQFAIGNIQTISSDLFRGPSVGTLAGLAGTIAAVSPMIMNWFVGQITTNSYTPAFIAICVSVVLGVLSIFILIKNIGPVRKKII